MYTLSTRRWRRPLMRARSYTPVTLRGRLGNLHLAPLLNRCISHCSTGCCAGYTLSRSACRQSALHLAPAAAPSNKGGGTARPRTNTAPAMTTLRGRRRRRLAAAASVLAAAEQVAAAVTAGVATVRAARQRCSRSAQSARHQPARRAERPRPAFQRTQAPRGRNTARHSQAAATWGGETSWR